MYIVIFTLSGTRRKDKRFWTKRNKPYSIRRVKKQTLAKMAYGTTGSRIPRIITLRTQSFAPTGFGVYSACTRNDYRKISGGKAPPARQVDSLTAICEPIIWTTWDPRHLTTHRSPWPVAGIALLFLVVFIVCNVSFTVCVALCAVFCLSVVVMFYLICVFLCCLNVVPLPPGKPPFAVQLTNNKLSYMNISSQIHFQAASSGCSTQYTIAGSRNKPMPFPGIETSVLQSTSVILMTELL
jgi:hypothetical protein